MAKRFSELSEEEVLGLAITLEEGDAKIYGEFAQRMRPEFPGTAELLETMQSEEKSHAASLREAHLKHFGSKIPYLQKENVQGFLKRKPLWLARTLNVNQVRREVASMEVESQKFYQMAAKRTTNPSVRDLLVKLAETEGDHRELANKMSGDLEKSGAFAKEDEASRRIFVLQVIQPGLAGLMDGSVSTLAPVFAAAFATRDSWDAFIVGLAASIGAGISMGFAEALSDDGVLSGRGRPYVRGAVCGLMTALGGIGHTIPFLISNFHIATTVAVGVVAVELAVISWVRHRYMDTPLLSAAFQVVVGGVLVFITGILIGKAAG